LSRRKAKKGRRMMQSSTPIASTPLPKNENAPRLRKREDIVYQGVTIAAILLVISSVVF
jgi:hypothetical protein